MAGLLVAALAMVMWRSAFAVNAGYDTWAYWNVDPADPYGDALAPARGAFLYTPAMAAIMSPLGSLPWEIVRDGWATTQVALLALLAGPFTIPLLFVPAVRFEFVYGNVTLIIAAVSVFGLRWPALWALPILMKATPAVGLAWFAARGEWRNLAVAVAVTGALAGASFVATPHLWVRWVETLIANRDVVTDIPLVPPLWVRWPLAALVVWLGARRGWAWVVPLAVTISLGHPWLATMVGAVGALWYVWRAVRAR